MKAQRQKDEQVCAAQIVRHQYKRGLFPSNIYGVESFKIYNLCYLGICMVLTTRYFRKAEKVNLCAI